MVALPETPPRSVAKPITWLRSNLFSGWFNSLLTLTAGVLVVVVLNRMLLWGVFDATWTGTPQDCAAGEGACWAVIGDRYRFVLFGQYGYDAQWRPLVAMMLLIGMLGLSCWRGAWHWWLGPLWAGSIAVMGVLMYGGIFGLEVVPQNRWGGLPLTLMLASIGIVAGFPLGVLLALGRTSTLPAIRTLSVTYIELVRGVPLITVLFMATVMFPLFLPPSLATFFDQLWRAQVGIILFVAAYLAEVVRGGLQAIPKGQYEAADALGLGYWRKTLLIILPQALRISIPPIVNSFIATFKDTSLVIIIGLFDLMNAAKAAIKDPTWRVYYIEVYIFVGLIYFLFCFFMSKYSQNLEKDLSKGVRRT